MKNLISPQLKHAAWAMLPWFIALVAFTGFLASGCALKPSTPPSPSVQAMAFGELALQVDSAEQATFDAGLITTDRHRELGVKIIRLLYAARSFERAVATRADNNTSRQEAIVVLRDLEQAVIDLPTIRPVIRTLRIFLESDRSGQ